MSETLQSTLLGAALTLVGVIVAGLLELLRASLSRRWAVEDRRRHRRIEIADRRIDQAEAYLLAIASDARDLIQDIEFHTTVRDLELSRARRDARNKRKDAIDLSIFAKGPALRSLGDDQLLQAYDGMIAAHDKISALYVAVGQQPELRQDLDPASYREAAYQAWIDLAKHLANAYSRLDALRVARSEC